MGKKKKKSSWDGRGSSYDYLRNKFENNYAPLNSDREGSSVYNSRKEQAWQKYLMTGQKSSGRGQLYDDMSGLNRGKDKSVAGRLFDAGIPRSQWDYYAKKAGITNVNSKSDAKAIINYYNKDERDTKPAPKQKSEPRETEKSTGYQPEELDTGSIESLFGDEVAAILQQQTDSITALTENFNNLSSTYDQRLADQQSQFENFYNRMQIQSDNDRRIMEYNNAQQQQQYEAALQSFQSVNNRRSPYTSQPVAFNPAATGTSNSAVGTGKLNRSSLQVKGINV